MSKKLPHTKPTNDINDMLQATTEALQKAVASGYIFKAKSKGDSEPVYTKKDLGQTLCPLAKIIRMVYIDHGITKDEFKMYHQEYCVAKEGYYNKKSVDTDYGNIKKNLYLDKKLSIGKFEQLLAIIKLDITNIQFNLLNNETGEASSYQLDI